MIGIFPQVSDQEIEAVKRLSYDERERLKDEINATNPAQIFQLAGTSLNSDKCKIICPACGNGTGSDKTPVEATRSSNGVWLYNCFKCDDFKGNLLKIIATDENLSLTQFEDFCKALAIGAELIHAPIELPRVKNTTQKEKSALPSDKLLKLIHTDIDAAQEHIKDLPDPQRRDLSDITLKHFGFGYLEQWTHPNSRLEGKTVPASRRIIIPTQNHYNAVALPSDRQSMDKKYWKMHAGKMELFNAAALTDAHDLIVVVEGEYDAASLWQVFKGNISVVAVLGAANWSATLRPYFDFLAGKKILILFDADDAGRKNAENLRGELLKRNIPASVKFFYDFLTDASKEKFGEKVDANQLLCDRGSAFLHDLTQILIDRARAEIESLEKKLTQKKQSAIENAASAAPFSDDERAFYFAGTFSDMQNARRVEKFCADDVRFLTDEGIWLTYQSGVWNRHTKDAFHILPKVYRFVNKIDATITKISDLAFKKKAVRLRNCFEDHKKINPAINLLRGCSSIRITTDDLDRHKNLLCAKNGIIDLETGKFFDADPSLLISCQLSVDYAPRADSVAIDKFFGEIMPDDETRAGLLRWLAYCLTGETREEKFLIWNGGGANGKGVLGSLMLALLNNYATGLPSRALLKNSRFLDDANRATTALNGLEKARFALSEELPADSELNVSLLKNLTGGDRINLRRNYGEFRTLQNFSKINISGNYRPRLENINDYGLLRRLLNMPFTVTFGKDKPLDLNLKSKLLKPENLRGLLRILVEQAQAWYHDGLIISALMKHETQEHLNQNNFVAEFIDDSDKYELNEKLCSDNSVKAKDFIDDLKADYHMQCSRFNRKDLIKIIESVAPFVQYGKNNHNSCVFKGIGKRGAPTQSNFGFGGKDVDPQTDASPW